jgi:hypothetical protein
MDAFHFGLSSPAASPGREPRPSLFGPALMEVEDEESKLLGAGGGLFKPTVSFVDPLAPAVGSFVDSSAAVASSSSSSSSFRRAEGQLVGVQVLQSSSFGQMYCGGLIGSDKSKICIRQDCSFQGHKLRKGVMIFDGYEDGEGVICIEVAPSVAPRKGSVATPAFAVYAKPTIAISRFPVEVREKVLMEQRAIDSWLELFQAMDGLDSTVSACKEGIFDCAYASQGGKVGEGNFSDGFCRCEW